MERLAFDEELSLFISSFMMVNEGELIKVCDAELMADGFFMAAAVVVGDDVFEVTRILLAGKLNEVVGSESTWSVGSTSFEASPASAAKGLRSSELVDLSWDGFRQACWAASSRA